MKSIMTTYPDFQSLPREVKKLLLVSENYFFQEESARHGSALAVGIVRCSELVGMHGIHKRFT